MWIPGKKELVIKPVDWGKNVEQKNLVLGTTYHEAFHQYLFYAMGEIQASVWFNEGYACVFGGAIVRDNKLLIQEDEYRVRTLEDIVKSGNVHLERLVNMTQEDFVDRKNNNKKVIEANYALAWGLVYYLSKGIAIESQSPYAGILDKYADALWTTKSATAATQAAFKDIDMNALDKDFINFWKSRNKRAAAQRNRIPGEGK